MSHEFLALWEPNRRSLIANQFCHAVREGVKTPEGVIALVRADAYKRLLYPSEQSPSQELLLSVIDTTEAREFAKFIIEREAKPREEREREKRQQSQDYQRHSTRRLKSSWHI
jgi:hypothetical protein